MFGHDDQDYQNATSTDNLMPEPPSDGLLSDDAAAATVQPAGDGFNPALPPADNQPAPAPQAAADPLATDQPAPASEEPSTPPLADDTSSVTTDDTSGASDAASSTDTNALLDIKQQALQQLSPLVGHLDQTPEEKFRTTMMMIQASDDQNLIQTAYEAAQSITDEKAKAQALLDIVNEINYFTHQTNDD